MGKVVKAIIGVALVVAGVVTGNFQLIFAGVSMVGGALLSPKLKGAPRAAAATTVQIGEMPRQALVGRAATAGGLVDAFNYGGKYGTDWEVLVLAVADHRCDALEGFYVNDSYVAFAGDGPVAGYSGQLSVWWRPGTENQTVPAVLTANGPGWTANDNGAGVAYVVVAYKADAADAKNPVWPGGRPRFLWVVRGALCYDARKDSSVGGDGAHRWNNPATRQWSENVIVARYNWARGFYACDRVGDPSQLLVGRGLSEIEAPPANVFARANLCDEVVDGQARYRAGGVMNATEPYIDVEEDFAAACAGTIVQPEGCVEIDPGEARAVVATFTDDDLIVGSLARWNRGLLSTGSEEWVNTVVASYIEPTQKWAEHGAPVRRDTADIVADGQPREERLMLGFVTWVAQAGRIAEIRRRFGRLLGRAEVTLPPRFAFIEEGDWVAWQSNRRFGGATRTFRVESWGSNEAWHHSLVLRQISASVYSDTAPLDDGSVAVQQPVPPAIAAPAPGSWTLAAGLLEAGGIATPALFVAGAHDDPSARFVRMEYVLGEAAPTPLTQWSDAGITGPDIERREIAVAAGGVYRAAVSYVVDGVQGARLVLGPVTAGAVSYPDGSPVEDLQPAEPGSTNSADPASPFGPDGDTVGSFIAAVEQMADDLEAAGDTIAEETARLDGRIDEAEAAISGVAGDLDTEVGRLDGRADAADAAISAARVRLTTESERLKAMIGTAQVGLLAEVQERVTAVSVQVTRIDGIIATLDDPADGLDAAHALIATLESVTVDLENPASLASKLDVLEAALDTVDGALSARVETLETATTTLSGDLDAAEAAIGDNADGLVALAGRTDTIEAGLDAQGEAITDAQAALTTVEQAAATDHAAGAYRAERMAAQTGLARVSVLAEVRVRATDVAATFDAIDVVDLKIETPATGLRAQLVDAQSAIVDLDTNKAEASDVSALTVTVADQGDRLTTAEGSITTQAGAIAGLVSDVDTIDGTLSLIADDLGDLDGRLDTAEGTVATLVGTASSLSARMDDAEDAADALDGRVTTAEADITTVQQAGVTDRAAAASAAARMSAGVGLARVSVLAERSVTATATGAAAARIDAIEATIDTPTTGLSARIGSAESAIVDLDTNKAEASALTALEAEIDDAETGLSSKASVTDLSTAVAGLDDDIGTVATDVSAVSTAVDDLEATVTVQADSIDGLLARYGVTLDVNGYVTGWQQNNDGTNGSMLFLVDQLGFALPGVAPRFIFGLDATGALLDGDLRVHNGKIVVDTGTYMKVIGEGFGTSNQFVEWFGPKMALNLCSEANGTTWMKTNGDAYFGGALSAGVLTAKGQTPDLSSTAVAEVGPFGTNGNPIVAAVSWTYTQVVSIDYPDTVGGRNDFDADVAAWTNEAVGSPTYDTSMTIAAPTSNLTLARKIGAGAFADVQTGSTTAMNVYFVGTRPVAGLSTGYATITLTSVIAFTNTDNVGGVDDRELTATLARGAINYTGAGSTNSTQRVSIVTSEE